MNEFIGRVIFPLRLSTSCCLTSEGRLTHASMSLTGMLTKSFVSSLSGASILGTLDLSPFACLLRLGLGEGDVREADRARASERVSLFLLLLLLWSDAAGVGGELTV